MQFTENRDFKACVYGEKILFRVWIRGYGTLWARGATSPPSIVKKKYLVSMDNSPLDLGPPNFQGLLSIATQTFEPFMVPVDYYFDHKLLI